MSATATATATATAPEPGVWARDVMETLALVEGGALARLAQLAAAPPSDAPEVFAALRAIENRLNLHSELIDPVVSAADRSALAAVGRAQQAREAYRALVAGLFARAESLAQTGTHDTDPIVLRSDFKQTAIREVYGLPGQMIGFVAGLAQGHPVRGIEPVADGELSFVCWGDPRRTRLRLSKIRAQTAEAITRRATANAAVERERQWREKERLRQIAESPEGQRQRLAELEAALKRGQGATPAAKPTA